MNIFEQALEIANNHDYHSGYPRESGIGVEALLDKFEAAGLFRSDPPVEGEVMAFRTTGNNSHLIEDCFKLGYLTDDMAILDPTYGMGVFWKRHRPPFLVGTDLDPTKSPGGNTLSIFQGDGISCDFTKMFWDDSDFDAVVFDPDYKMQGTSSNAGPASSNSNYGMDREYRAVEEQLGIIYKGLEECVRVTKPGGVIAVKHMDQIVSGKVTWQTDLVLLAMYALGCSKFAAFHLEGHRKQPTHDKCRACNGTGWRVPTMAENPAPVVDTKCEPCKGEGKVPRRQVHERRNYSTLALYRKAKS